MKKLIGSVAIAAMVAGAAFAEVNVSAGFQRGIVAPIASDGDKVYTWEGISWNGADDGKSRVASLNFSASSENVGLTADFNISNGSTEVGDNAYVWAKPVDFIQLKVGKFQENTGRQNACWGLWDWIRGTSKCVTDNANGIGEDFTFENNAGQGFSIIVTPIENLWFLASVDVADGKDFYLSYTDNDNTRYAAGYTLEGIGSLKVNALMRKGQFFTNSSDTKKPGDVYSYCVINPAVEVTALENVVIQVGAFIPTQATVLEGSNGWTSDKQKDPLRINANASIKVDAFTFNVAVGSKIGLYNPTKSAEENEVVADRVGFVFGGDVQYDFGNSVSAELDVRYCTQYYEDISGSDSEVDHFIAGLFLNKGLTNGGIGVGFEAGGNVGVPGKTSKVNHDVFTWSVPVRVHCSF